MDENVPLVGLTSEDKVDIVSKLLDYTMKSKKIRSRRRWVQVRVCVIKTTKMLSYVDFQTMLQENKDREYHRKLDEKIWKMIKRRVKNNEDILSMALWRSCIKDMVGEDQVMPFDLEERCIKTRNEAIEYGKWRGEIDVDDLEKKKVNGYKLDELDPCAICQEGMFLGEEATYMPCSHVFHSTCIGSWLDIHFTCPLCRHKPTQRQTQRSCDSCVIT